MDECFEEFLDEPEAYSIIPFLEKLSHVFVLKAFTKIYAMAGLRLGYALCSNEDVLTKICQVRQPWSVSGLAQRAGIAALKETEYVLKTRKLVHEQRKKTGGGINRTGLYRLSVPGQLYFRLRKDSGRSNRQPVRPHAKTGRPHPQLLQLSGPGRILLPHLRKNRRRKQRVLTQTFPMYSHQTYRYKMYRYKTYRYRIYGCQSNTSTPQT